MRELDLGGHAVIAGQQRGEDVGMVLSASSSSRAPGITPLSPCPGSRSPRRAAAGTPAKPLVLSAVSGRPAARAPAKRNESVRPPKGRRRNRRPRRTPPKRARHGAQSRASAEHQRAVDIEQDQSGCRHVVLFFVLRYLLFEKPPQQARRSQLARRAVEHETRPPSAIAKGSSAVSGTSPGRGRAPPVPGPAECRHGVARQRGGRMLGDESCGSSASARARCVRMCASGGELAHGDRYRRASPTSRASAPTSGR